MHQEDKNKVCSQRVPEQCCCVQVTFHKVYCYWSIQMSIDHEMTCNR